MFRIIKTCVLFFLCLFSVGIAQSASAGHGTSVPKRCEGIEGINQRSACIIAVHDEIDEKCGDLSGAEKTECGNNILNAESSGSSSSSSDPDFTNDEPKFVRNDCNPPAGTPLDSENCGIIKYLLIFINVLSGLVGIIIVIMITYGGIQYSAAGDNPQTAAGAKKHIMNAIIALLTFIFMFALLQYFIPGGVL